MTNPEFIRDDSGKNYSDPADSLVWIALGIDKGSFEREVDKAVIANRIGALARAAARLQIISDNDMRSRDDVAKDNFILTLQNVIDERTSELPSTEQRIYNAIREEEEHILGQEQDDTDFHLPYM